MESRGSLRPLTARLSDAPLPALDFTLPPWPADTIVVGSTSLCLRRTLGPAGAEPALYVHGLGGSPTNWTDLAAQLAGYVAGAALDLPGFGWSDPAPRGRYSLGMRAPTVMYLYPTRVGWAIGDRRVVCVLKLPADRTGRLLPAN